MKRRRQLITLTTILIASLANAQAPASAGGVGPLVQNLMSIEVSFEQMQPPGMSIEAKEISRTGSSGKDLVVEYHIFVKGVPPGTLFQQISWPVNADKPSTVMEGITVGKEGVLMCAGRAPEQCGDPAKLDDPIEFITMPIKGEPSRFAFIAPDIRIGTVIVPDPIEARDGGCTLRAVRLTSKFELAFISGSGYPPNADVHYKTSSEKSNDLVVKADSKGIIRTGVIPFTGSAPTGTMKVKVTKAKCSPEVSYIWGTT